MRRLCAIFYFKNYKKGLFLLTEDNFSVTDVTFTILIACFPFGDGEVNISPQILSSDFPSTKNVKVVLKAWRRQGGGEHPKNSKYQK